MAISISISITQNSQNVTDNTSNVTVKVNAKWTGGSYNKLQKSGYLIIDGTKYPFTSSFNTGQSTSGSQTLFTKTVNITHNSNGSKTVSCSASYTSGVSSGTVTASASKVLTTIPRKSTISASDGTLGTAQTLTVTRQSTSFTHSIKVSVADIAAYVNADGSIAWTEVEHSDCSIPFTAPLTWARQNTTGTTISLTFTITTYNGNTSLGTNSKTVTYSIPSSVKPSCRIEVSDPTGCFEKYGCYVQNQSKIKVVVTPTLAYNSPIAKYSTIALGKSFTTSSFTTPAIPIAGDVSVSSIVTDKRGRESDVVAGITSKSFEVKTYYNPIVDTLTVHRCNEDGTENNKGSFIKVDCWLKVCPLNSINSATYTLKYKKSSDNEYTSISLTDFNGKYTNTLSHILEADTGSSYDIRVEATDDFGTTVSTTSVSTAFTLMHWLASGLGMAIGKIAELANVLDIGFQTRFSGGILHPILEPETDLNDVLTPNTYVGANLDTYNYANCPIEKGTFTLEVTGAGEEGQVKQRLTVCSKDKARTIERFYYQDSWGEWICVSDFGNILLWSGEMYMQASHEIALAEKISKQPSGIVLVFSEYANGSANNSTFHTRFIPKMMIAKHVGTAHTIQLSTSNIAYFATKHLYIHDEKIVGHDNNTLTITGACGITATNKQFVLRYVIGV